MNRFTPQQALQKIQIYCAYQERNHYEVKEKLYGFGLYKEDVEALMATLIEQNYLNEERYAAQFAGGKFRMKKWGRNKISQELKFKKISPYNIKTALQQIDQTVYLQTLEKLTEQKWVSLKADQYMAREAKTTRYLLQKGYEFELIKDALRKIREK